MPASRKYIFTVVLVPEAGGEREYAEAIAPTIEEARHEVESHPLVAEVVSLSYSRSLAAEAPLIF